MNGERDHVIVVPTPETSNEIQLYMKGCPFDHQTADTWHVTLYVGQSEIPRSILQYGRVYRAKGLGVDYWYDNQLQRTNLVITMESEDLQRRHEEIMLQTGIMPTAKEFVPHLTLVYGLPQLSPSIKSFKNSLAMTMHRLGDTLMFTGETLVDSGGYTPNVSGMKYYNEKHY